MKTFVFVRKKLESFLKYSWKKFHCFWQSCKRYFMQHIPPLFRFLLFHANPFYTHLLYHVIISVLGYVALRVTNPRTSSPNDFDLFFTSVSAATVSSMSTVEMEVFSNAQLLIMTILMFVTSEVFISMLELQVTRSKFSKFHEQSSHQLEMGLDVTGDAPNNALELASTDSSIKYNSITCLGYIVLGYLLGVHICGSILVYLYVTIVPSARQVLIHKGIGLQTFAVFTTTSSFSNCGFIPTNENMIVFRNNSGLLLVLIPQILLGNTLFPACLRFLIWVLEKSTRRSEFSYMLKNYKDLGFGHLLSGLDSCLLVLTALCFTAVQVILFCVMEWKSEAMDGLNGYQKFVASVFQSVNSRHAGESIVDISLLTPAILGLLVVMMYLPAYTRFMLISNGDEAVKEKSRKPVVEYQILSQVSCLAIFVILICITEGKKMKNDPLNFNVFNIIVEVISAYGNVGMTTGYSCKRQLKSESASCKDAWYGFVGRWSMEGQFILVLVMFFGRLKKYGPKRGKAWKVS